MVCSRELRNTYEPSSHSGSIKLPPPLTPGIHDFLAAAAATISFRGPTTMLPVLEENSFWLLFPPFTKGEPSTAADVAAIAIVP